MKTKTLILPAKTIFQVSNIFCCFYSIKCNPLHRIGNIIQALVNFIDSLVIIMTLGFVYTKLPEKWMIYRIESKWYQQNNS